MSDVSFIYCEGCGARLTPQDRSCPKCGHPAPGILSAKASASNLAAGNTASFPKLTPELINSVVPEPSLPTVSYAGSDPSFDPDATDILDGNKLSSVSFPAGSRPVAGRGPIPADALPLATENNPKQDPFARKHGKGKYIAAALVVLFVAGGAWFVSADPMGVMPGFYEQFNKAASEAFPSRQAPEGEGMQDNKKPDEANGATQEGEDNLSDGTMGERAAYQRLSAIYGQILIFQDDLGPAIDQFNGYYMAKDRALRTEGASYSYNLRDQIQTTLDEIDEIELPNSSAYVEDVDHMRQLATWMFNRVNVLCEAWDISLGLSDAEYPPDHQNEILAPLRNVEMVNGKAIDVVEYERNVANWKPQQK